MDYALILDCAGAFAFGLVIGWIAGTALWSETRSRLSEFTAVFGALAGGVTTAALTVNADAVALYSAGLVLGFLARAWTTRQRRKTGRMTDILASQILASRDAGLRRFDAGVSFSLGRRSMTRELLEILRRDRAPLALPAPQDIVPEVSKEATRERSLQAAPVARVLNANFADLGTGEMLKSSEIMCSDTSYDLLVDIGPRWVDGLSIATGLIGFPEDQLPPDEQGHQIQVVFVSDDFTTGGESAAAGPHIATAALWLPSKSGQSFPIVDGRRRDNPGPVALRVKTPRVNPKAEQKPEPWSEIHGRLCLYFENNLLQSAAVRMHVCPPLPFRAPADAQVLPPTAENEINVDFVLTGFRNINELSRRKIEPLSRHASKEGEPITLNLTLNDDGGGNHRIVISTMEGQAALRYDPIGSAQLLADARSVIGDCYWQRNKDGSFVLDADEARVLALAPDNGKSLEAFKWDLFNLADYGSKLFGLIFNNVIPPAGQTQLEWIGQLQSAVAESATIQVSRTSPAQYIFPWGLVYDHPLVDEKNYMFCKIIAEEWGPNGRRKDGPIATACPHRHEDFHQQDIICPYGFWGLRHRIEQPPSLPIDGQAQPEASRTIGSGPKLDFHAGFTFDTKLDQNLIASHIAKLGAIPGLQFAPPPARDWTGVRAALKAPQVAYFLCHGEFDAARKESYLGVGLRDADLEHRVYVSKLNAFMMTALFDRNQWKRIAPLIVINGCHTTDLAPGQLLNFVSSFASAGASGIIGTEVSVILPVAVEVGEMLFTGLTQSDVADPTKNRAVADVIRSIRWQLLNRGNLLGLAYTPYCFADLRVR